MRDDTPPRNNCADDDELGILIDDGDDDFGEDIFNDDDELEEVELEDLEHHLSTLDEGDENQDEMGLENGITEIQRATPEDNANLTFSEHAGPVFSIHMHPEHDIAVSGGQDDIAYIWDLHDGHVIEKLTDHTDTVTSTKFSFDGNYLHTADMAGSIFVFRVQMGFSGNPDSASSSDKTENSGLSLNKIWSNTIGDMSWCFWHDRGNVLFASSAETGEIYMWRIPSGECKVFVGPGSCCAAGELTEDGKKLFASYNDGSLRLWDLRAGNTILLVNNQHENEMVPSLACDKHSSLYASGDWNGKILFSTQNGPVQSVRTSGLVECLAFSPSSELKMLASATMEGETTIWDCSLYTKRLICTPPDDEKACICSMKWLNGHSLAIGTSDGDILIYDARTGSLKFKLTGHRGHVYEFYYSRRTNMLISASEDSKAKIFIVPELGD